MQKEKNQTGEGINEFIQKHRKLIYVIMSLIIVFLITCIAAFSIMDVRRGKAIAVVEEFNRRYEELRPFIGMIESGDTAAGDTESGFEGEAEDGTENEAAAENEIAEEAVAESETEGGVAEEAVAQSEAESVIENEADAENNTEHEVAQLLAQMEPFAKKNSGYAGGKAWSIIANIYSDKKEWAQAEAAWANAAGKSAKSYLEPLAWFNAGIAAEEQEKITEAIDYYAKSLAAPAGFPSAPRAQFSIGRLHESLNDTDAAIEAYRAVIAGWPNDQIWTNLANSRIIILEIGN